MTKIKAFDKLTAKQQEELLQLYTNNMDALERFESLTDEIENFQVKKEGVFGEAVEYILGDLLETVELPWDVAYIVAGIDLTKEHVSKIELDLVMQIVRAVKFKGRQAGINLYNALKNLAKPVEATTQLQLMQSEIAKQQFDIETAFNKRISELKVDGDVVVAIWKSKNEEHPALIRFAKLQEKAGVAK